MLPSQQEPRICFSDFQLQYNKDINNQQNAADYVPFNRDQSLNDPTSVKISAFAACKEFLACGTFDGRILIYTYDDDKPKAGLKMTTTLRITGLSFNKSCSLLLASCLEGNIWLIDLASFQTIRTHQHGAKILDCAIDPESQPGAPLSCVFIDSNGSMNSKQSNKVIRVKPATAFFGRNPTTSEAQEISNSEVSLEKVVWQGDVIAWASSKSFTIYKNSAKSLTPYTPHTNLFEWGSRPAFLFSPQNDSLIVFFKGALYDVTLSPKVQITPQNGGPLGMKKNVIAMARTPDFKARLIQFGDKDSPPKIEFQSENDCYEAAVPIINFDQSEFLCLCQGVNDIILALPWNVIGITRATQAERIEFYLTNDKIEMCFSKFREAQSTMDHFDRFQLVLKIIRHLLAKNDIDSCVKFCKEFATPKDWVEIIKSFEQSNKLKSIAPIIPLEIPELSKDDVTKILRTMVLECPVEVFQEKFKHVMPSRYNPSQLIGDISRQAEREPSLNESLMILQHSLENHQNGLQTALGIKHQSFFQDIETFSQYDFVKKNFFEVLRTFPTLLPDFLMRHVDDLPPEKLLRKSNKVLNRADKETTKVIETFKLNYLDKLYKAKNPILNNEIYGTELASLYIKNKKPETMEFLQNTTSYRLMEICREAEAAGMYNEAAFLYYTAGSKKKGMEIHLKQLRDPRKAIEYAKQCDDKDVWKMISEHAYKNKDYLECMLNDLPNLNIKMKDFINKIPENMKLDNFEELARKSLNEYKRKLRTAQLAYKIVSQDAFGAFKRSFESYKTGKKTQF